jgi:large subunit ribosomal protein L18
MFTKVDRKAKRKIRQERLRKKICGSAERPRLAVFRSNRHIYAQLIDDQAGRTIVAACSNHPELCEKLAGMKKTEQAVAIGTLVGERALVKGISTAVFDRGGGKFHGRIKALCEAAREAGLKI